MSRTTRFLVLGIALAAGLAILAWRLTTEGPDDKPLLVGIAATLTGNNAELGIQTRNGVALALEDFNARGGIEGRPVKLVIKDDQSTPEGAVAAATFLLEQGVCAIVGHSTSAQTMAGLKVTDPAGTVMISPTASTTALSGKDDFFFRVVDVSATRAEILGRNIHDNRGCATISFVYDTVNRPFTQSFVDAVRKGFESAGGRVLDSLPFDSGADPDFLAITERLGQTAPEAVCIVASDINTALVSQRIRLAGLDAQLFTSSLAFTPRLLSHGGSAVEGILTIQSLWVSEDNPAYFSYMERYRETYGERAAFGAVFGYEAGMILFEALKETGGRGGEPLKQALLGLEPRRVLTETISFDAYGDVSRPYSLLRVRNGKFVQDQL
jgi:branched-chain amino acid transport system substrate-binding protein